MRFYSRHLPTRGIALVAVAVVTAACSTTTPRSQNFSHASAGQYPSYGYGNRVETAAIRPREGMRYGPAPVNTTASISPRPHTQPNYVPKPYHPHTNQYARQQAPAPHWQQQNRYAPAGYPTARAPYQRTPHYGIQTASIPNQHRNVGAPITTGSLGTRPTTITVREGDTLYNLSRRSRVPVADIVAVNRLRSSHIKVGQKLIIPARRTVR